MFKCEVTCVRYAHSIQETQAIYRVSDKGNSKTNNHQLTGKVGNRSFTIGQIDKSIKIGDLLRCDGLPFLSKPLNRKKIIYWTKDKPYSQPIKNEIYEDAISGYSPFQLDSGYWVLRKK